MTSPRLDSSVVGSGHGMTKNGEELVNNLLIGQLGVGFLFLVSLRRLLKEFLQFLRAGCWLSSAAVYAEWRSVLSRCFSSQFMPVHRRT